MKADCWLRPLAVACLAAICGAGSLGPFESNTDIGAGLLKGKVESSSPGEYRVTGGGADMWARRMPSTSSGRKCPAT